MRAEVSAFNPIGHDRGAPTRRAGRGLWIKVWTSGAWQVENLCVSSHKILCLVAGRTGPADNPECPGKTRLLSK